MQLFIAVFAALLLTPSGALAGSKNKPVTPKSQLQFGVKMAQQGLWSEALFRFEQAEKLGASPTTVYNNMAVAYEALGAFEQARESYRKALELDPSNASLRGNYARFVEFYQSFKPEGDGTGADGEAVDGGGDDAGTADDPLALTVTDDEADSLSNGSPIDSGGDR